jgi:hypothetical protein
MSLDQKLGQIEKILLEHKGKANAIPSNKIAELIGINEDATMSATRGLITDLLNKTDLPIGACEHGYYLIQTQAEYDDVVKKLNARAHGIFGRIAKLTVNFQKYYGTPIECDDSDEDF